MIPNQKEMENKEELKIDKKIETLGSFIKCDKCNAFKKKDNIFMVIDKNQNRFPICNKCVNMKLNRDNIVYYDTYEFYHKRLKSGFIDLLLQELKNNEKN